MSTDHIEKLIADHKVEFVDLRFTDMRGVQHHVTFPKSIIEPGLFEDGKMFDGSSISGWRGIHQSDMVLLPDPDTAFLDPFTADPTLVLTCDVLDPTTMQAYTRDPRGIARRAEAFLKSSGIAEQAFFGPEPEFFIFDSVRYANEMGHTFFHIDSEEAHWNSSREYAGGNTGYRPGIKGGYFPVPPVDAYQDIRSAMCDALVEMGMKVEVHHHEVATGGQCEIGVGAGGLVKKADEVQILKYAIQNVAHSYGKTATFMPKPLVGDNGSGMHVHQSLQKAGTALFAGDKYGGLSDTALYYIGGIIKHAKAINAFTNPGTNSYKRLVPGFEAPVMLAYSARNRSASIRIPWVSNPKARRIEVRFPDSLANPYFAFAAMMMAGLDGIQNKIHPGEPADKDLYDLEPEEEKHIPQVCHSLDMALEHLDKDREFLTRGGVFTNDVIDAYIGLKMQEVTRYRMSTHPVELDMYYSC
jgi:glutamine synthetase